ncbi:MAG: hypothetical protein ACKPKO_20045, partial [Candidatus Fonsibacter sp.]
QATWEQTARSAHVTKFRPALADNIASPSLLNMHWLGALGGHAWEPSMSGMVSTVYWENHFDSTANADALQIRQQDMLGSFGSKLGKHTRKQHIHHNH